MCILYGHSIHASTWLICTTGYGPSTLPLREKCVRCAIVQVTKRPALRKLSVSLVDREYN